MTMQGLLYIALVFVLVLGAAFPLGRYMAAIFEGRVTWLRPLETGFYRLAGVDDALDFVAVALGHGLRCGHGHLPLTVRIT